VECKCEATGKATANIKPNNQSSFKKEEITKNRKIEEESERVCLV
jgi:hypothetical protein